MFRQPQGRVDCGHGGFNWGGKGREKKKQTSTGGSAEETLGGGVGHNGRKLRADFATRDGFF